MALVDQQNRATFQAVQTRHPPYTLLIMARLEIHGSSIINVRPSRFASQKEGLGLRDGRAGDVLWFVVERPLPAQKNLKSLMICEPWKREPNAGTAIARE